MKNRHSKGFETKAELRERICYLEKEIERLTAILEYKEESKDKDIWDKKIDYAFTKAKEVLDLAYKNSYTCLRYIRVDKAGYWFTYRIDNVDHSLRVSHNDVSFVE